MLGVLEVLWVYLIFFLGVLDPYLLGTPIEPLIYKDCT